MGLETVGIQYTSNGLDPFLKGMNDSAQGAQALGGALTGQAVPGLEMIIAKGAAMGSLVVKAFDSVTGAVSRFYNQGIQAVTMLQDVELNLQSLSARQIITSGATDSMTEALDQAIPIAASLMEQLKALSIESPFQYKEVLSVYQMNVAFGVSADMAMKLTRAITNLGAISKNIPGIMQRLSYNFSQMSMVGQITMRDVRDLAMAGLDLAKVLQLTMGKSIKEVNADLKAGKISFEEVSQAVVDYTDKYVGPAAERASRTLGGLGSTLADITFFLAGDLLKDSAQTVTNALGSLLDIGMAIIDSRVFKIIGATFEAMVSPLEKVTKQLEDLADNYTAAMAVINGDTKFPSFEEARDARAQALKDPLYQFIEGLAKGAEKIADMIADAFDWGLNLVSEFAAGMVEGIATTLTWALDTMSGFLEWMMAPGSPPKFLPDIDVWGAGAFTAYLEGFSDADFGVLDKIQSVLKSALGLSLGGDTKGINELMIGFTQDIAAVLAGSMDKSDLINKVLENTKMFGSEVAELVSSQIDLAAATDAVREAEEKLKNLREDEKIQSADLNEKMQEYNKLRAAGASPEVLRAKMAEIQASRKGLLTTKKEAATTEKELATSEKKIRTLTEEARKQENIVKQLTEMAQMQQAKAAGGAGGGGDDGDGSGTNPPGAGPLSTLLDNFKTKMQEKFKGIWDEVVKKWDETIGTKITDLQTAWDTFSTNFSTWFTERIQPKLDAFLLWTEDVGLKEFFDKLPENLGIVAGNFLLFGAIMMIVTGIAWALTAALGALSNPIGLIILALGLLKTAWDTDFLGMQTAITNFMADLPYHLYELNKWIYDFGYGVGEGIADFIDGVQEAAEAFGQGLDSLGLFILDSWNWIVEQAVNLANGFIDAINVVMAAIGNPLIGHVEMPDPVKPAPKAQGPNQPWSKHEEYAPPQYTPFEMTGQPHSTPGAGSWISPDYTTAPYTGTTYNITLNNTYSPGAQPRNPSQDLNAWQTYNNLTTTWNRK